MSRLNVIFCPHFHAKAFRQMQRELVLLQSPLNITASEISILVPISFTNLSAPLSNASTQKSGCAAEKPLRRFEKEFQAMTNRQQTLEWEMVTNTTSETCRAKDAFQPRYNRWMTAWKIWARSYQGPTERCSRSTLAIISSMKAGIVMDDPEAARYDAFTPSPSPPLFTPLALFFSSLSAPF